MNLNLALKTVCWSIVATLLSFQVIAADVKEDIYYAGISWTQLDFQSVAGAKDAKSQAGTLIFGSYISDYVKTEVRAGFGIDNTEVNTSIIPDATGQRPFAEIGLDYYYSWYMGAQYPATDYLQLYGLFGLTHMIGEVSYPDPEQEKILPDDLTDSSFSISYVLGVEVNLYKGLWGGFEYGRLHKDTLTGISTFQLSAGLKYEF